MTRPHRSATATALILLCRAIVGVAGCGERSDVREDVRADVRDESPVDPADAPIGPLHARIATGGGEILVRLRPDEAPVTCANFANLVERGFYDGLGFYRHSTVIRQAGNPFPDADDRWGPGYTLAPEFSPDLRFDVGGRLAAVRANDDPTAPVRPTEFFLTTKPQSERFTFVYPIFGEVVEGQDVVNRIRPDDVIERISLEGDPGPLFDRYRDRIDAWNERLDRSGLGRRRDG